MWRGEAGESNSAVQTTDESIQFEKTMKAIKGSAR